MNFSVRNRPFLRRAAFVAAFGALMVPASAGASVHAQAAAKKRTKLPVVTSVRPMSVAIGETLEIRGKHFIRGRYKNSVVFKRDRGRAVFVKAKVGTTKLLRVTVPKKIEKEFAKVNGVAIPTRFRIRVLTKKLGKRFTKLSKSPVVNFKPGTAPPPPVPTPPARTSGDGDCDSDGILNAVDADDDNDLLSDAVENGINATLVAKYGSTLERIMNVCSADSDEDGVEDGYEYRSARDLNDDEYQSPNSYLPYPGKRPYANPLADDADQDFDGDVLQLGEEFRLWQLAVKESGVRSLDKLWYSDGMKYSIYTRSGANNRRRPALARAGYVKQVNFENWLVANDYEYVELEDNLRSGRFHIYDSNRDGLVSSVASSGQELPENSYLDTDGDTWLSDDERDEDADGLSNYTESHGPTMDSEWWNLQYEDENSFDLHFKYGGTDLADSDTDGDFVRDGADDIDHDDVPNMMEVSRNMASGHALGSVSSDEQWGRVNPFNPCLPGLPDLDEPHSRTCPTYVPLGNPDVWAPFDDSANYATLN